MFSQAIDEGEDRQRKRSKKISQIIFITIFFVCFLKNEMRSTMNESATKIEMNSLNNFFTERISAKRASRRDSPSRAELPQTTKKRNLAETSIPCVE